MIEMLAKQRTPDPVDHVFVHEPLRDAREQIRLVHLWPRSGDSPPSLSIIRFELANAPSYKALSYTWGEENSKHTILMNRQTFTIRKNLYDLLETKPDGIYYRWLWIDQLCINQNDVRERDEQVSIMGTIFKGAEEVLIWLGPESPKPGILEHMASRYGLSRADWLEQPSETDRAVLYAMRCQNYWSRVWIVQEVLLAKKLAILWGLEKVNPEHLRDFTTGALGARDAMSREEKRNSEHSVVEEPYSVLSFHRNIVNISHLIVRWFYNENMGGSTRQFQDFYEAFGHGRAPRVGQGDCLDPRDHIYGFYALFSDNMKARIEVDYAIGVEHLFLKMLPLIVDDCIYGNECLGGNTENQELASSIGTLGQAMLPDKIGPGSISAQVEDMSPQAWIYRTTMDCHRAAWNNIIKMIEVHLKGECVGCAGEDDSARWRLCRFPVGDVRMGG